MIEKRVCLVEDHLHLSFMEDLFSRNLDRDKYELTGYTDLSDEKVYKRHLPKGFDVYWIHSSSTEFEAINEIKEEQP